MAWMQEDLDVLLVRLGSTAGLEAAEGQLELALRRAGARVYAVRAERPRAVRTLALTDLAWAYAARRAAHALLAARRPPRATIYSTLTATLLWERPGAIVFDAPAAANRPGRHGVWQRPVERRRLRAAPLLLPSSAGALAEASAALGGALDAARALVLPVPIAPAQADAHVPPPPDPGGGHPDRSRGTRAWSEHPRFGQPRPARDVDALTYAANPSKKGLDRVLDAWRRARRPGERLVVAGIDRERLRELGYAPDEDVHVAGMLPPEAYRELVRRARVFVCAPRREEYGLAQLEALAEGCQLVTAPAPGGYVALPLARTLDPRLVGEDLAGALRAALDTPTAGYASRAAELVEPYTTAAVDRLVAAELLPRLLGTWET